MINRYRLWKEKASTPTTYIRTVLSALILLYCCAVTSGYGQGVSVSGTVTDPTGESVPGVNILEKGTGNGTVSDMDGNYQIALTSEQATLVFSFIGYETQEISVNGRSTIDVVFSEGATSLDEVVVVGYGTLRERDLTSAISTIRSEDIVKTPNAQAMQALQGRVAGVQIVSSGAPGAGPTVRVRGVGSFEGGAAPLYVVDGMFFENIDFLNPADIETISVLKDASASAIYGVRAANGVVVIETKSGSYEQQPEIVYDGYYGVQNPQNVIKMANAQQYVRYVDETGSAADMAFVQNAMQRFGRSRVDPNIPAVNTDWYSEVMRPATIQNHSLTFNGGSEKTRYSIGGSYFDQKGLMNETRNDYQRLNFRVKIDADLKDWVTVGANVNISTAEQFVGEDGAWFRSYFAVPILPVYDESNTAAAPYPLSNAQLLGYRGNQNPFYDLLYSDNRNKIMKINGNIYADIDLLPKKLFFRTAYNYGLENFNQRNVRMAFNDGVTNRLSSLNRSSLTRFNQIWDNFLTYEDYFGDHNLTVVLGQSYRSEIFENLFARGENLNPNPLRDREQFWYLSNASDFDLNGIGDSGQRLFFQSYFSRVAYNYDDRYLLYGTVRRDGNNKFQKQWGNFFTAGVGWVLSSESFFNVDGVDFLKFRGSWGQLGNDNIGASVGAPVLEETRTAINNALVFGRRLNPTFDLIEQWETTVEINLGINSRFFKNRLSLDADYFIRDTRNLAVNIIPPVFRALERRSVGEIRNEGLELTLNWEDSFSSGFSYYVGGNLATLKNQVLSLGGPESLDGGSAEFRQRSIIGQPFQSFYGYQVEGVFQNQEQISSSGYTEEFRNANNLQPGDFIFKDQNGDGMINDADRVVLGSFLPRLNYGFNAGFSYRNLSFSALLQGQVGHSILNRKRGEIIFTNDTNIDADLATNLWRGEGTSNIYPSAAGLRKGWNQNMSSYFVEDGSYWRVQNVRLSYLFEEKSLGGITLPNTTITLTADRPLTVFSYNGFTPEVANGIDRQVYPIPAIYTLGLNIKL
nr:SusC/RagA family TonB-linked outer membrane protein [Cytophagales bacterium]